MMQQIANHIVDHDPMMVLRRTHDTVRYIRWAWNKEHADPIDEAELRLFLCDEHYPANEPDLGNPQLALCIG